MSMRWWPSSLRARLTLWFTIVLGVPLVATDLTRPAAAALDGLAERLASRKRGLAGRKLKLNVG